MPNRREFLSHTAAGGALMFSSPLFSAADAKQSSAAKALRVLILGGTGFIGPHFVNAALSRGHKVAVFNRGKSQADLPKKVERLIGDRNGDLRSIENRDWDAVFDLGTYGPVWVRSLGQALKNRIGHYTFISSIDVYKDTGANANGTDENSPTVSYTSPKDPYTVTGRDREVYGPLKLLCEQEGERQFPGRSLAVRPGYMVGPGDPLERFTYWLARMDKGGDILAPGDPMQPVQFIDSRDIAKWCVSMAERGEAGVYNALGPRGSMSMCEMLGGIRGAFGVSTTLHWVSIPWIDRPDIVETEALDWHFWRFSRDEDIRCGKAYAKGLACRPLYMTALETLAWYKNLPAEQQSSVKTLKRNAAGAYEVIWLPWQELLEREHAMIVRWQTHRSRFT